MRTQKKCKNFVAGFYTSLNCLSPWTGYDPARTTNGENPFSKESQMKLAAPCKRKCLTSLTLLLLLSMVVTVPLTAAGTATETEAGVRSEKPAVEVVFVLDTTGSMGGLIAAAKEKIWSIANTLASGDPAPAIRMGIVGYRDRGDRYVTSYTPLTDDLDAVYAQLMQFTANGGGDGPESVNQALYEAVTRPAWNRSPWTYRVIFLVGDAPPHMDYQEDVRYQKSCRMARNRDIIVNTIQCGDLPETRPSWQAIAQLAGGRYFQVVQEGGAVLYDTPYDKKISALSRKLDNTRLYYGTADERAEMEARRKTADRIYLSAAPSAVAKRTLFNTKKAGAKNFAGSREVVSEVASGKLDLDDITTEELPEELQSLSSGERRAYVQSRIEKRKRLQAEIEELGKKRQAFIANKVKAEKDHGASSLDARIYTCIQTQAAKKRIHYRGGPEY
jgi:Mg-chelatase subunit ChlD